VCLDHGCYLEKVSCQADYCLDENREIVVKDNYTLAILRHLLRSELIQVVIPVVYNMCMDFGTLSDLLATFVLIDG
jgi:hypothetical protein